VVTHNEKEKWECRDATTLLHVVSLVNTIFACDPLFVLFFPHPWSLIQPLFFGVSIFFFIFCRGCVGCFTLSYSLCTIGAHLSSQLLSSQVVYTHTHTHKHIYTCIYTSARCLTPLKKNCTASLLPCSALDIILPWRVCFFPHLLLRLRHPEFPQPLIFPLSATLPDLL
jgi:hypothetical protein